MSPALITHVAAGSIGILSGTVALCARKGERLHRLSGTVFFIAMLLISTMGAYLASRIPQRGTAVVGIFTAYFVVTAWMTVRRKEGSVGYFEYGAPLVPLASAAALFFFGLQAANSPTGLLDGSPPALYFVFALFAAIIAAADLRMALRGGIAGVRRIARHLWRMCFALFFAAASFFLGQQKVMPAYLHHSPLLYALAFAPLVLMIFWLIRIRFIYRAKRGGLSVAAQPAPGAI